MKLVKIIKVDFETINNEKIEPKYFLNRQQAAFYLDTHNISNETISRVECLRLKDSFHLIKLKDESELKTYHGRFGIPIESDHCNKLYAGCNYTDGPALTLAHEKSELDDTSLIFYFVKSQTEVYELHRYQKVEFTPMPAEYLAVEPALKEQLTLAKDRIKKERKAKMQFFEEKRRIREQKEQELKEAQEREKEAIKSYHNDFLKNLKVAKK